VQSTQALIRVTRNGTGHISTSAAFTILGSPTLSLSSTQCEGYFAIDWAPVNGATDYEVFQLQGTEMVSIGTTASTSYIVNGLASSTEYWITVCARLNGQRGRKAFAITRIPNSGTCTGTISNNDIKMDSIVAPVYGRLNTSTALTTTTIVSARIKNLDDANITSFKMRYYVGGTLVIEDLVSATITPGNTFTHNFSVPYDFSTAGNYILKVEVENTTGSDPVSINNSITDTVRQLNNDPIPLPFTDNLETAISHQYYKNRFGISGVDRYDFTNTDPLGRLSTFLSSGMAYSGSKSLIMDFNGWNGGVGSNNFIYGTYNLNGINEAIKASSDYGYIIMQFTGSLDKNGKEIYEGDIVRWMSTKYDWDKPDGEEMYLKENISFIVYKDNGFWVNIEDFGWEGENLWNWEEMEVIGNLYENPELEEKFTSDRQD